MGDRNNPIKFGPEWLRNLSRERSAVRSSNNQAANSSTGAAAAASAAGPSGGAAAGNGASNNTNTHNMAGSPKVLLAKLRYGREEMLALYDRNAEAPPELKFIDTLYQPRGKQPLALNNTFEDDMRDNMRNAPPGGSMSSADRYGMGRGAGRGGASPGRGAGARTYTRPSTTARGSWHVSSPRTPSYGGGADDDGGQMRPWNNNNLANRNSGDQTDWANKPYRSKRQGANTNWRQHPTRDEAEEWRSSEPGRSRQLEKWDRDWGERPGLEKSQSSWNTNRRTWVGGDTHSNENLPEWIGENAECGGTFDSQGAFHGYSNDDTNLPKNPQESSHPLIRSHTHGNFVRSKTVEEGSDEWWASEKAKKLSPKRFDASDIKFKKQPVTEMGSSASTSKEYGNKSSSNKDESRQETPEQQENAAAAPEPPEPNNTAQNEDKYGGKKLYKTKYAESKTFDGKMRSENINMDEGNDERGNFQSVIIAPNNSLRQKHQNMVPANEPSNKAPSSKPQSTKTSSSQNKPDVDHGAHKSPEDVMVVNNMFRMPFDELEILSSTSPKNSSLLTLSNTGMPANLNPSSIPMPHQNSNMQMNMSNAVMPNQGLPMDLTLNKQNMQASGHENPGIQTRVHASVGMQSSMQMQGMPTSGMQPGKPAGMHNPGMSLHGMQSAGMPLGSMQNPGLPQGGLPSPGKPTGMQNHSMPMVSNARMTMPIQNPGMGRGVMQNPGMHTGGLQNQGMPPTSMHHVPRGQNPAMQSSMMQQGGMTNSALNASLGLPIGPGVNMGMPLQNVPQPVYPNADNMGASGMQGSIGNSSMQPGGNMPGFQAGNSISGGSNSLFLGQTSNNAAMSSSSDIPMPNHAGQNNMFPMHGLQHSGSQGGFGNVMYGNNMPNPAEQWYYEDPESIIQGPFSTRDMLNWYRAGFFSATLMVRRACETNMRPLGSYGPVPFTTMDMMPQYPMPGNYDARPQGAHDTMMNSQAGLGLDVMKINRPTNPRVERVPFGSVRQMGIQSFNQPPPPMVDLLWGQPSNDLRWMHNSINDSRVNNLSMFFWDQQPSAIASNALLPEEITKEMKTEDQILAQLRASQNMAQLPTMPYMEQPAAGAAAAAKPDDRFAAAINATPNLEELHRLMQKDTLAGNNTPAGAPETTDPQPKIEKMTKPEPAVVESNAAKVQNTSKATADQKAAKQKTDNDKVVKNKENNNTKNKSKKNKDDKKDEVADVKTKEDEVNKAEKRSQESSPSKNKKEDKSNNNKKELEREKKEWIKEGFTIVKGPEKTVAKDGKRKAEETRAAEEMERKRKEEEKLAAEEEKKKKQAEALKKQEQQQQQQQQRQASESAVKKAPWSAIANQTLQAVHKDGLTLAEIQRLEREKKLEQMKEQQQMMQIIAEQQAVALAREQEMQAGLGWAKKKGNNFNVPGQSLAEIQAEARKQAVVAVAAAAAAQAQALEEAPATAPQTNHAPWANTHNGVGFWDTPPNQSPKPEKTQEPAKPAEASKTKKKITLSIPAKKEVSPVAEFETWCTTFLAPWSAKIDVPTFIGFLKDIESPYEVKDYVKCYLGDSKDSNDFARQFLERRSKLLRVGMVTPSDDLCSPAIAVNPRTISGSDYQEVKGKVKKSKKNKMLKIDARILGFSVTAAEDRINVGDIDTV